MDAMSVYIANLGKYVEGEEVGAWFTLPVNIEDVKERIGLNSEYEECAIHDCDNIPFEVDEYMSLEELNRCYYLLEEIEDKIPMDDLKAVMDGSGYSVDELAEHIDDVYIYEGIGDMEELARYRIDEEQVLGEIPEKLRYYIDYSAYARDLEIEGYFVVGNHGIYEICM